jgi:predicted RNA-binding Zn-ribbon protein involved in translation (DUF1610 family)
MSQDPDQDAPEQELPECPNCGSQNIERLQDADQLAYHCRNCDTTFRLTQ